MITDRRKFTTKLTLYAVYEIPSCFHFYFWNRFRVIPLASSNFLQCPMRVNNTVDNADITQLQAANHHGLLSHVTLGLVNCRH